MRPFETLQSLEVIKEARLFQTIRLSTEELSPQERRETLAIIDNELYFDNPHSPDAAARYVEEYFLKSQDNFYLYYYNAAVILEGVLPILNGIQSNIAVGVNSNIGILPEINQSMF